MSDKGISTIRPAFLALFMILVISAGQSCLKEIPETFPSEYEWKPALAFPIGEAEFGLGIPYGFDTLLLQVDEITGRQYLSELEQIPLSGKIDFDFSEVLGIREELDFVKLRVNTYNGFPTEVELQAYLLDAGGTVLDSLFTPLLRMDRGEVGGGGQPLSSAHNKVDILIDSEKLDLLMQAKQISFEGLVNNIFFFASYSFRIQLAAVAGINYQF